MGVSAGVWSMEKDGWRFVGPAGIVTVVLLGMRWLTGNVLFLAIGGLGLAATAFLAFFFRDPQRQPPEGDGWIVSPADGRVLDIADDPQGGRRIAIFLSVFDIHVNRAPVTGRVEAIDYRPGRFLKAYDPRASTENERAIVTMDSIHGPIEFALIAGILARRVVCRLTTGQDLRLGERIGLIRFGSRAEIVVPAGAEVLVTRGDRVKGGVTPLARFRVNSTHG